MITSNKMNSHHIYASLWRKTDILSAIMSMTTSKRWFPNKQPATFTRAMILWIPRKTPRIKDHVSGHKLKQEDSDDIIAKPLASRVKTEPRKRRFFSRDPGEYPHASLKLLVTRKEFPWTKQYHSAGMKMAKHMPRRRDWNHHQTHPAQPSLLFIHALRKETLSPKFRLDRSDWRLDELTKLK